MSFSVQFIGTPKAVCQALDKHKAGAVGSQSQIEYDAVKPALKTLVSANVGEKSVVNLTANGHATVNDGVVTYSSCNANVTPFYGLVQETPETAEGSEAT